MRLLCLLCIIFYSNAWASSCYPSIDPSRNQYVIGYGSFMNEMSKAATVHDAGKNIPIQLIGFQRGWALLTPDTDNKIMYLGVSKSPDSIINAVIFKLVDINGVLLFDQRETWFCRQEISLNQIKLMVPESLQKAQFWLYVPRNTVPASEAKDGLISQAYVDVFLSGCLAIQRTYSLPGFAAQCIATTQGWQRNWVKDRGYRKRYFIQPEDQKAVDQLIKQMMPKLYKYLHIIDLTKKHKKQHRDV